MARTKGAKDKKKRKKYTLRQRAIAVGSVLAFGALAGLPAGLTHGTVKALRENPGILKKKAAEISAAMSTPRGRKNFFDVKKRKRFEERWKRGAQERYEKIATAEKYVNDAYKEAKTPDEKAYINSMREELVHQPTKELAMRYKKKRKSILGFSKYTERYANFARTKGAKDKQKRKRRSNLIAGAAGTGTALLLGAGAVRRLGKEVGQQAAESGARNVGPKAPDISDLKKKMAKDVNKATTQTIPQDWKDAIDAAANNMESALQKKKAEIAKAKQPAIDAELAKRKAASDADAARVQKAAAEKIKKGKQQAGLIRTPKASDIKARNVTALNKDMLGAEMPTRAWKQKMTGRERGKKWLKERRREKGYASQVIRTVQPGGKRVQRQVWRG